MWLIVGLKFFFQRRHIVVIDLLTKSQHLDWFGSEFYLKLYRNRNIAEAQHFIENLLAYLEASTASKFIDVCCGRGRHARFLAQKGHQVLGIDNSAESIAEAKKHRTSNLDFAIQDIKKPFPFSDFDVALNLFTSFGYFDKDEDSLISLQNIGNSLKKEGSLVIDFLNERKVVDGLVPAENIHIDGCDYNITRKADHQFIYKNIKVTKGDSHYNFQEQVRRFKLSDFDSFFQKSRLKRVGLFGNYEMESFDAATSDRLIIHAKKTDE